MGASKSKESRKVKKKDQEKREKASRELMKNQGMIEFDKVRKEAAEETKKRITAQDKERAKKAKETVSKEWEEASKRKKAAEARIKSLDKLKRGHGNERKIK